MQSCAAWLPSVRPYIINLFKTHLSDMKEQFHYSSLTPSGHNWTEHIIEQRGQKSLLLQKKESLFMWPAHPDN